MIDRNFIGKNAEIFSEHHEKYSSKSSIPLPKNCKEKNENILLSYDVNDHVYSNQISSNFAVC